MFKNLHSKTQYCFVSHDPCEYPSTDPKIGVNYPIIEKLHTKQKEYIASVRLLGMNSKC